MNSIEQVQRLQAVQKLVDENYTEQEISEALGISVRTVQRLKRDLRDVYINDLTPITVAQKRSEVYLDLMECMLESKDLYKECVTKKNYGQARQLLSVWAGIIQQKARLFGLDSPYTTKPGGPIQIGADVHDPIPKQIDHKIGEAIAKEIKSNYEDSLNGE